MKTYFQELEVPYLDVNKTRCYLKMRKRNTQKGVLQGRAPVQFIEKGLFQEVASVKGSMQPNSPLNLNPRSSLFDALGLPCNSQEEFWDKIIAVVDASRGNQSIVYQLIQDNQVFLDENFPSLIRKWGRTRQLDADRASDIGFFSDLIINFKEGNQAVNPEISIACHELELTVFTFEEHPLDWAAAQHGCGNTYMERLLGDRKSNLEKSIQHYEEALRIYNSQKMPKLWATTQHGLGKAYLERVHGERAENQAIAMDCFQKALKIRERHKDPRGWASIQHSFGKLYYHKIRGDRKFNLQKSIFHFEHALEEKSAIAFMEVAATQSNLGSVYRELAEIQVTEEYIDNNSVERSISYFQKALKVFKRENFPYYWAAIQNNLGVAYRIRRRGKSNKQKQAIDHFKAALQVHTRERYPEDWAMAQNNLGDAYQSMTEYKVASFIPMPGRSEAKKNKSLLKKGFKEGAFRFLRVLPVKPFRHFCHNIFLKRTLSQVDNLELVIKCFEKALQVHTPEAFPQDYIMTQSNLGRAYQKVQRFHQAYEAFSAAIDTLELLRSEILFGSDIEEDKQKLSEKWNPIYQAMIEVCLELNYKKQALQYAERSKTRNLLDLLSNRNHFPKGNINDDILNKLSFLRREIASEQRYVESQVTSSAAVNLGLLSRGAHNKIHVRDRLNELKQTLNNLITEEISPIDPDFRLTQSVEPISFRNIQDAAGDNTAIIEWYIAKDKWVAFIITPQTNSPIVEKSTLEELEALFDWAENYLRAYFTDLEQWKKEIDSQLQSLAKILHIDKLLEKISSTIDRLILIPHRVLHLIPVHALPLVNKICLFELERFRRGVQYAPSYQVLQLVRTKQSPNFTHLFAIQNPKSDLPYIDLEVTAIQNYFDSHKVLKKATANKSAFNDQPLNTFHCLHFGCHGSFEPDQGNKFSMSLAPPDEITLDDIFNLNLEQCRLVVLPACETGLIDWRNISDEYIGWSSGFLFAGAPTVVSSLWAVESVSTAFLMIRFYKNLGDTELKEGDVAVSLKNAQIWLRDLTREKGENFLDEIQPEIDKAFLNRPIAASKFKKAALRRIRENGTHPFSEHYCWAAFITTGV